MTINIGREKKKIKLVQLPSKEMKKYDIIIRLAFPDGTLVTDRIPYGSLTAISGFMNYHINTSKIEIGIALEAARELALEFVKFYEKLGMPVEILEAELIES